MKSKIKYKRLYLTLLIPVSLILTAAAKYSIAFADFYSIHIYPMLAKTVGFITGLLPFSAAEAIIVAGSAFLVFCLTFTTIKCIKKKELTPFKLLCINLITIASCAYLMYVLLCGMNYYRHQFTEYSGLEIKPSPKEELVSLCESLAKQANELREIQITDDNNVAKLSDSYYETAKRARTAFKEISVKYDVLQGNYPKPKLVFFSKAMSYLQISGIYIPMTAEANVNEDIPSHQIPVTMCHELTHLRGFMREDEANFIAYMACVNSGYDDFAYSGVMLALTYSMNALYGADYGEFERICGMYSDGVKTDMNYVSAYWKQFETKIAEISDRVNDAYLRANNQDDGVKSYGRMVDLLLAEQRQKLEFK